MFEDWSKDIKAALYERMTNPFLSSFFISWLVINWKILYVTFVLDSKDLPSILEGKSLHQLNKLEYIEKFLLSDKDTLFFCPLYSAIAFVTIFPILSVGVFWLFEIFKKWKKQIRAKILEKAPLFGSELLNINSQLEEEKEKQALFLSKNERLESQKGNWDRERIRLQNEIQLKDGQLESSTNNINSISKDYEDLKILTTNRDQFLKIFNDSKWKNTYQPWGQDEENEIFEVRYNGEDIIWILHEQNGKKFSGGKIRFKIKNIRFERSKSESTRIIFIKIGYTNELEVFNNNLLITSPEVIKGFENDSISVTYERQKVTKSLAEILPGKWIETRTEVNGASNTFTVEIIDNNTWLLNGEPCFYIDMVEYDGMVLKFRKEDIVHKGITMYCNLISQNNGTLFYGEEYFSGKAVPIELKVKK